MTASESHQKKRPLMKDAKWSLIAPNDESCAVLAEREIGYHD